MGLAPVWPIAPSGKMGRARFLVGFRAPHLPDKNTVCPNCGKFVDELNSYTGWCSDCSPVYVNKLEVSLAANANGIEFYMQSSSTLSVWQALRLSQADRATCIVCGNKIARASRTAIFCRKTPECRRYSRRYVYLYREKGHTKVEALALILNELTGD